MRLTKDMRNNIQQKIMANVPVIHYHPLMAEVIQAVLCKHMTDDIRRAYEDPAQRPYLYAQCVEVRDGNDRMTIRQMNDRGCFYAPYEFYGLPRARKVIRVDDASVGRLEEGTLDYDLSHALIEGGYYRKHKEQEQLYDSVRRRVVNTLNSVTTVKRLYDVLEPELHHFIPKENDKKAGLPATAAPFADDLKKLGAELPTIPKKG